MSKTDKHLTVEYDGPIDPRLEKMYTDAAKACGWKWYAQGYDLMTGVRDIAFDKLKNS